MMAQMKTLISKGKRIHRNKSNIAFHMMQKPSVEGNFIIIHTSAINLVVDFYYYQMSLMNCTQIANHL